MEKNSLITIIFKLIVLPSGEEIASRKIFDHDQLSQGRKSLISIELLVIARELAIYALFPAAACLCRNILGHSHLLLAP